MGQEFSFADFTLKCRRDYALAETQSELRLEQLFRDCERLLDQYHPDRSSRLDCKPGCGSCCIVNVSVLFPEALSIVEHLEQSSANLTELKTRLDLLWTSIRGLDDEDRSCMRKPCAFLDTSGSCSIYPVRPLLCRGVTSTDADSCRESFSALLYNEKLSVPMNLFQRDLYSAAYLGLSEALEEKGLDGRGFEVTGLVRYLLNNPQGRAELNSGLQLNWLELA